MKLAAILDKEWKILVVCDNRGNCEFNTWLAELSEKTRDSIIAFLDQVAVTGSPKRTEVSHQIDEHIWQWTPHRDIRIAWFYDRERMIIISHGYKKHGQKTKEADKARARSTFEAYFWAKANGQIKII